MPGLPLQVLQLSHGFADQSPFALRSLTILVFRVQAPTSLERFCSLVDPLTQQLARTLARSHRVVESDAQHEFGSAL
jgi:hypothetical protein